MEEELGGCSEVLDGGGHELAVAIYSTYQTDKQQETASPKPAMLGLVVPAQAQPTMGWDAMG